VSDPDERQTLAHYPYPIVCVACRYCSRRGQYHLERLVAAYGRDTTFDQLLSSLSADCTRASDRTGRLGCRGAYLPDLQIAALSKAM
jgi:hypothetical protein